MGSYTGYSTLGTGANGAECHGSAVYKTSDIRGTFDIFWGKVIYCPKYAKITSCVLSCQAKKVKTSVSMPSTVRWGFNKVMRGTTSWDGKTASTSGWVALWNATKNLDEIGTGYSPYSIDLAKTLVLDYTSFQNGFNVRMGTYNPYSISTYKAYAQYKELKLSVQWTDPRTIVSASVNDSSMGEITYNGATLNDATEIVKANSKVSVMVELALDYEWSTAYATITATPKSGYVFKGWKRNSTGEIKQTNPVLVSDFYDGDTIRGFEVDESYTAIFEKPTYNIKTESGTNGTITPSFVVDPNESATVTATANERYIIKSFTVNGTNINEATGKSSYTYTINNVNSDQTISVTFEDNTWLVSTNDAFLENGSVTPRYAYVTKGQSQVFKVIPDDGYEIDSVTVNGVLVDTFNNEFTVTPTGHTTCIVTLIKADYTPTIMNAHFEYLGETSDTIVANREYRVYAEVIFTY